MLHMCRGFHGNDADRAISILNSQSEEFGIDEAYRCQDIKL